MVGAAAMTMVRINTSTEDLFHALGIIADCLNEYECSFTIINEDDKFKAYLEFIGADLNEGEGSTVREAVENLVKKL